MRKGYVLNLTVDDVKKSVEKALSAEGVKLPVFNEFTNMANAEFPGIGYAWVSWRANDDKSTAVMIESRTSESVQSAYDLIFKVEEAPKEKKATEKKKTPAKKKAAEKTEKKAEVKDEKPDQGALPVSELGLKGNAAKAFLEGSGANTLADVANLSVEQLQAIPGVGPKTVEKIVAVMAGFGFKLK